jgi:hypothetical protein
MLIEKSILWEQPISYVMTGSTSTGINMLQSGAFAPRSNPLAKICNTINLTFGNASYTLSLGDIASALEHYTTGDAHKFNSDIGIPMLDQYQLYDSGFGSNRNPLQLYSSGMNTVVHRGACELSALQNTPTGASFTILYRAYLPISPLSDQIKRAGGGYALSHLDNLNIDINLVSNIFTRTLSFMQNRNGDVLTITSGTATIGQPIFRFVQLSDQLGTIPPAIHYPLKSIERYNTDFSIAFGARQPVSSPVIQTSRWPSSMLVYARPTNAVMMATSGAFVSDAFACLREITVLVDGQTLLSNSDVSNHYKIASENGLVDNFVQYKASPVLSECSSANGSYVAPASAPLKLEFNKDICLSGVRVYPGQTFKTNIQVNATFLNVNPNITSYSLYIVFLYNDILTLYDNNLALINNAPLSSADVMNSHKLNETVHYDVMRDTNLSGGGLLDCGRAIMSSHKLIPMLKHVYGKCTGSGGSHGGSMSGGAMAHKSRLHHGMKHPLLH